MGAIEGSPRRCRSRSAASSASRCSCCSGCGSGDDILAPFGSSTIFVFIGAFIIAQAMLDARGGAALRVPDALLKWVSKSTRNTVIGFGLIAASLSALVSNAATVAMLLPTAIAILATLVGLMKEKGDGGGRQARPAGGCAWASR